MDIRGCCTGIPIQAVNVQLCVYYVFVYIACDLRFVSSGSELESGTARQGRFP
jgi:hypothetical protein